MCIAAQFAAQQNLTAQLRSAIQTHRDTWITESDFAFMASIGINSVRLGIGYWVLAETQVLPVSVPRDDHLALTALTLSTHKLHGTAYFRDHHWVVTLDQHVTPEVRDYDAQFPRLPFTPGP